MTSEPISSHPNRNYWLTCDDAQLLQECRLTEFQSSGPGGQKRNRKYSSIRIAHSLTGFSVTAVQSRSQNENKATALKKLRRLIAMEIRNEVSPPVNTLNISLKNDKYPSLLAVLFDTLHKYNFSISDAAKTLKISTNQLVKLLAKDTDAWQKVNHERKQRNLTALK